MTRPRQERGELSSANAAANEIFGKMGQAVQEAIDRGETELSVAAIARIAGLDIDEREIDELQIDRIIYVHPWLAWPNWWPWRPLWCWWWHRHYWWYRCCPFWWHRCHWYPWG